jgi:hypothetical protein
METIGSSDTWISHLPDDAASRSKGQFSLWKYVIVYKPKYGMFSDKTIAIPISDLRL